MIGRILPYTGKNEIQDMCNAAWRTEKAAFKRSRDEIEDPENEEPVGMSSNKRPKRNVGRDERRKLTETTATKKEHLLKERSTVKRDLNRLGTGDLNEVPALHF